MSLPASSANRIEEILPGVWHWWVADDRIGGLRSESYALAASDRLVLVDPLPVDESKLTALGEVEAIVLTAGNHQRAAWRMRRSFKCPVHAPRHAFGLEDAADYAYSGGDLLPGELVAFHAPGPVESMHALWHAPSNIVFLSDLLSHDDSGGVRFVPSQWQDEPWRTRDSVRRLAETLPLHALGFGHGKPIVGHARQVLERALANDDERPSPQA